MKPPVFTPVGALTHNESLRWDRVSRNLDTFFFETLLSRLSVPSAEFDRSRPSVDFKEFLVAQFRKEVDEAVERVSVDVRKELDHRARQVSTYFKQWSRADDMLEKAYVVLKEKPEFAELVIEIEAARTQESTIEAQPPSE